MPTALICDSLDVCDHLGIKQLSVGENKKHFYVLHWDLLGENAIRYLKILCMVAGF